MENYYIQCNDILTEIREFQSFLETNIQMDNELEDKNDFKIGSLFIIMIKNELEFMPHFSVLEDKDSEHYKYKILLLQTNIDFVDAGETFMGNYFEEQKMIESNILEYSK